MSENNTNIFLINIILILRRKSAESQSLEYSEFKVEVTGMMSALGTPGTPGT